MAVQGKSNEILCWKVSSSILPDFDKRMDISFPPTLAGGSQPLTKKYRLITIQT
jgi:hypothetical protein